MIPADKIVAARNIDIIATAQRFTVLKRSGVEWVGPCPKCGGKDRFAVNVRKQIWNCRGCGKGGDVISLVAHATGTNFAEAIAELTGETIATDRRPPPRELATTRGAFRWAWPSQHPAHDAVYVIERGAVQGFLAVGAA